MRVAIVHDYLTQRGGAERVVLAMARAFPDSPIYTSLYDPAATFPEFSERDVRTSALDRVAPIRRNHRLGLPLLATVFGRMDVDADVVLCSSSGWAHGVKTPGRKIVYCHNPPRWLYQSSEYMGGGSRLGAAAGHLLGPTLKRWDRRAAATAERYLVTCSVVRDRVRMAYGIEADIVPPPPSVAVAGAARPVAGVEPGFLLCVSRLLPYKNVDRVVAAFADLPQQSLVVVGDGPEADQLLANASSNVRFLGVTTDEQLRWLYAHATGLVAASYEDYGLTPLEAAAFGKPSAVLRWGGYLDTMSDLSAEFFEVPSAEAIAQAVRKLVHRSWNVGAIKAQAERFDERTFTAALRGFVRADEPPHPSSP